MEVMRACTDQVEGHTRSPASGARSAFLLMNRPVKPGDDSGGERKATWQLLKKVKHYSGEPIGCNVNSGMAPPQDDAGRTSRLIFDSETNRCPLHAMSRRSAPPP